MICVINCINVIDLACEMDEWVGVEEAWYWYETRP